jgi:tetratricopeptide (TPR) repeat protein
VKCAWVAVLVIVVGCSSAPPAPEGVQVRKDRAADYLRFGRNAFQEAQYDQALSFYQMALDLNTAVDNVSGMAVSWNSAATALTALGRQAEARASLVQAEALADLAGDQTIVLQVAVNRIQADLANGQTSAAQKRLEALQPFPATAEGAALDHALGSLEKDRKNYPQALADFDRAAARNRALNLKQEEASNRFMKAAVLALQDQWADAQTELEAALALDKVMENTLGIGLDWRALGTVATHRGQGRAGFDAYVRAFRVFQAAGLADQQRRTAELLIPAAEALGLADEKARYQAIVNRLPPTRP